MSNSSGKNSAIAASRISNSGAQFPIGNYILDFVCLERRVILELDGGQHGEPGQEDYDSKRDAWLRSQGFNMLRFWNHQVMSEWEVIEDTLWEELHRSPSSPTPLPRRGEGE